MKEILIFAGTTEGRKLSECLSKTDILHTVCVATEYGEIVLTENPCAHVHRGRMDVEEMKAFISDGQFAAVVDATHPYAQVVTENIRTAMEGMDIPYIRLKRETDDSYDYDKIRSFKCNEDCAEALLKVDGNILLTTGSKELSVYCGHESLKDRLYVRVLPGLESLSLCNENGIVGKHILALQGPFTADMNEAMLRQYDISCLVTKKSGRVGGYTEKLKAAKRLDIPVYVIERANVEENASNTGNTNATEDVSQKTDVIEQAEMQQKADVLQQADMPEQTNMLEITNVGNNRGKTYSFRETCELLNNICHKQINAQKKLNITLAGVGMGNQTSLTKEVEHTINEADIILGAKRMIGAYEPRLEKKPYYMASDIIPYLKNLQNDKTLYEDKNVVILFSGDSGFYSGCQSLYRALMAETESGALNADISIMPGISSIAYLAACTGESYQDAKICSIHGKKQANLADIIRYNSKTFMLMSGVNDVNSLGQLLLDAGLNQCIVIAGYELSYETQEIMALTPIECVELKKEGLYTCLIKNPYAKDRRLTHGKSDSEFIRDKVPMTKEEVREVSICKLRLTENALVYDIGSGTGSIAMEMAGLSPDLKVYAIERKPEAVALIKKNKEQFKLDNIEVIEAEAPEGFGELPKPTHAFIGGSGGNLDEILNPLYRMNDSMRIVITAVSLETIAQIKEILSAYPIANEDIVELQVNRSKVIGKYHMMQAENPVWICSFDFREGAADEAQ